MKFNQTQSALNFYVAAAVVSSPGRRQLIFIIVPSDFALHHTHTISIYLWFFFFVFCLVTQIRFILLFASNFAACEISSTFLSIATKKGKRLDRKLLMNVLRNENFINNAQQIINMIVSWLSHTRESDTHTRLHKLLFLFFVFYSGESENKCVFFHSFFLEYLFYFPIISFPFIILWIIFLFGFFYRPMLLPNQFSARSSPPYTLFSYMRQRENKQRFRSLWLTKHFWLTKTVWQNTQPTS